MTLPGLVVVGYRRADSLINVLNSIPEGVVSSVLVSLDGPSGDWDRADVTSVEAAARNVLTRWAERGRLKTRDSNVGSAVNVLGAVSQSLHSNAATVVLEDDCIPSADFWDFTREMLARYERDRSILCVCGSQLSPSIAPQYSHLVSDYSLMWGWATWRPKWREFQALLNSYLSLGKGPALSSLPPHKRSYWRAGFRRSSSGFIDAWDIPLQSIMLEHNYKAVLPTSNLVSNVGNDAHATHVGSDSRWTRVPVGDWNRDGLSPTDFENGRTNSWLEEHVFGIRPRHLASTAFTRALDLSGIHRRKRLPLNERLNGPEHHEWVAP